MAIARTRQEVDDFLYQDIDVVEGYSFNQYNNIKRCHLYMNNQFEGDVDGIFHNIVNYRRDAIARFLDIDTKDIRLLPTNPKSVYSTLFLEEELKHWLKKNKFAMLLNDMATELATYGSCVLRKTQSGAEIVDLRRLFIDPSVTDILDSRFITIKHILSPSELKEKTKDGWDAKAIDRIIEAVQEQESDSPESYEDDQVNGGTGGVPLIEVYERYGELTTEEAEACGIDVDKDLDFVRAHTIVAEPHRIDLKRDDHGNQYEEELGEILYAKQWRGEYPFRDVHYAKTQGRWLGVGVIESLFPAQERINEVENQKRVSMELSSIHLFQTTGDSVIRNVLTDLSNGDLIVSKQGITPVVNEERNLQAFQTEHDNWNVLADRISFANDVVTGGAIPASTPATNAVIQNTNSISVFLFKRQNFALFLQEFFNELVLPQVLKDLSAEHILRYTGDPAQLDVIDDTYVKSEVATAVLEAGRPLSAEEIQAVEFRTKDRLSRTGNVRFLKIKENLYKDLEFEFDILITNEQENTQILSQNTFSLLQTLANAPQLMDDPVFKTLFMDYAQKVGFNPARLELAASQRQSAQRTQTLSEAVPQILQEAKKRANIGANGQGTTEGAGQAV